MSMTKSTLRLGFHGMWADPTSRFNSYHNYFTYLFQQSFRVEIVEDDADILIYSVYGEPPKGKHAKNYIYFPNEVAGALYERAKSHKYEQYADVILSCNPVHPKDIYFGHFVIYVNWWKCNHDSYLPQGTSPCYLLDLNEINNSYSIENLTYRKFGCATFINNPAWPRSKIIDDLRKWIPIHSYGRLDNNTYGPFGGDEYDKIVECSLFTHSLAIENSLVNGYCSEKLIHSFASGSIPIFWGQYSESNRYFNNKLMIHITQETLEGGRLIQYVKERTIEIMNLSREQCSHHKPLRVDNINQDFSPAIIINKILDRISL
jgi:hypothetical protein